MDIEAVLLTGGASRRMGRDKAALDVNGRPLAEIVASRLLSSGVPVTVLGPRPMPGCGWLPDRAPHEGPLAALSAFRPVRDLVFVCSCDLPLFDVRVVTLLEQIIGDLEAAIPMSEDRLQPLCALYRAEALGGLPAWLLSGDQRVTRWVETLRYAAVSAEVLTRHGLSPYCVRSANTPEELSWLLSLT